MVLQNLKKKKFLNNAATVDYPFVFNNGSTQKVQLVQALRIVGLIHEMVRKGDEAWQNSPTRVRTVCCGHRDIILAECLKPPNNLECF